MSEIQTQKMNQIEVRKKVFLMLHNDNFVGKDLEPIILVDNEKIYTVMVKKKYPYDMYYFFENKKYLKAWNDKKGNILLYYNNWSGDLFVNNEQTVEHIDKFNYTAGSHELVCENKEGERKIIKLEGFDIIEMAINQFSEHEVAIFYILCYKLS